MLIYGLIDPTSGRLRYIGRTGRTLGQRMRNHIKDVKRKDRGLQRNHRTHWLRSLLDRGLLPSIVLIEECSGNGACEEIYHVALARADGCQLVNSTAGGDGCFGATPELREKMRIARKGFRHSEETKALLKDQVRARYAAGYTLSPEARSRISDSKKGIPKPKEAIAKQVAARASRPRTPAEKAATIYMRTLLPKQKTESWKLLMSKLMSGRAVLPEHRAKIAASLRGRRGTTRTAEADELAIVEAYKAGARTVELAADFNVRRDLVSSILRRYKVPLHPHVMLPHQVEKIRLSKIGKTASAETRRKMSLSQQERRQSERPNHRASGVPAHSSSPDS